MGTFIRTCLGLLSLWLGIGSPALSATIAKTAAIVTITGENTTTTYGNVTALHARVTGANPGGLVTFKAGSKLLGTGNLDENNTAHLVKRLEIGTHSITAAYSGDAYNSANTSPVATVTINKGLSTLNWSFGSYYPAVGVAFPITLAVVGFDATPPTGTLSLAICKASCSLPGADVALGTQTLLNGAAAFSYTPTAAGDVNFIAIYSGDARNQPSDSIYAQRFPAKATPAVSAYPDTQSLGISEPVNILAKVFGANATGSVQFIETVNGVKTTRATCTLVNGSCTSRISFTTAGPHAVTPTYLGNTFNNTAPAAPISFSVTTKHLPRMSLAISPNPILQGETATLIVNWQGYFPSATSRPAAVRITNGTQTYDLRNYVSSTQKGFQARLLLGVNLPAGLTRWEAVYPGDTYNDTAKSTFHQEILAAGSPPPGLDTWNYGLDAENNLTLITDPDGDLTTRHYDGLHRLTAIVRPDPVQGGTNGGPTITVTQDLQGQTIGVHDSRVQTRYDVDGLGRTKSETSLDITRIDRVFDDLGRPLLIQPTAPALPSVNSFDEISRLTRIDYTSGSATEFFYDGQGLSPQAQGQLTHLIDESGTTDYAYSAFGEVTSKTQAATIAGISNAHIVRYDWGSGAGNTGHLTRVTYPSGSQIEYVYGTDGRISQVLFHPVLPAGSSPDLSASAETQLMSGIQWTAWGTLGRWMTASGHVATRTYDTNGRLTSLPIMMPSYGIHVWPRNISYDTQGRVTHVYQPYVSSHFSYAYDALDRLTGLVDATGNSMRYLGYAYDTSNNRTLSQVETLPLNTTVSPDTNRLYAIERWSSTLSAAGAPLPSVYYPVHDNAGRLVDDGLNTYTYSDRGRLSVVRNAAGTTSFLYNGLEQRVAKSGPLGTFFYVYDEAGHLLGEYTSAGRPLYEVVWLNDIPVGVIRTTFDTAGKPASASVSTVFVDHLNTPRAIYDAANTLIWSWQTPNEDPYAQTAPPTAVAGFTFNPRMPGQIFDKETGLFHNGHRDYNPATGRYIQPDPIGLNGGINRYAYVGGNPLSYTDPLGLWRNPSDIFDDAMRDARRSGLPGPHNGLQDAYRHCLASCEMARENTAPVAQCLGWANEKRGDWTHNQQAGERQMDDFNNAVGVKFGRSAQSAQECRAACMGAAMSGGLRTYQPDTTPGYLY